MSSDENNPDAPRVHLDEDLCVDLLHGQLPPQEEALLLAHVENCADCDELLRRRAAELENRRAMAVPQRVAGTFVREESLKARPRAGAPRPWRWLGSGAAVAAAAVLVFAILPRESPVDPEGGFWIDHDLRSVILRSASGQLDALEPAVEAYESRDAATAVRLFQEAQVSANLEDLRQLYLASALLHAGRPRESATHLRRLHPLSLPMPWKLDGLRTLHAALLGSGQRAAADSLVAELRQLPGEISEWARGLPTAAADQ